MSEVTADLIERDRLAGPGAHARKRLTQRVGAACGLLTTTTGNRAFDLELLRTFAQSRMSSAPALALVALVVSIMSFIWAPGVDVLVWLALVWACHVMSFGAARRLLEMPDARVVVAEWRRRFIATEFCQGAGWALLTALFVNVPDTTARIFVLFALMLIGAIMSLMSSTVPLAVYAGLAPTTIAVVLYLNPLWQENAWPMAIVGIGAQVFFLVLAHRLYATSLSSLAFRLEKDILISELEESKANSDEARRRAEEANLAKSRFLATMSHELRTPLNAILGFSEVMTGELFGKHAVPAYKDYAKDIHSSGEHLLMLINEILDLSRVEAGRYELREECVSLAEIVEDCLRVLSLRAEKRGITISETIEGRLPRLWGDERAMRQIALNLLNNAVKFTPYGGHITLKCGWTQTGGQYLSIRDTGPGIPPHEIPIVMSSFGRGALAQKNAEEGSGLGLPIVKGLVDLHGGTFTIESELRAGTEVTVTFPADRVVEAMPPFQPERRPPSPRRVVRRAA
ncbi:MAG: two-component sensor histidine kinase [Hyphomicrobiales bacterium]|nr:two-component sensor histidine kinase [Hyphomicrobiales bacterium]